MPSAIGKIIRSEAHFAGKLYAEFVTPKSAVGKRFFDELGCDETFKNGAGLEMADLQSAVYLEPAPFRDWWHSNENLEDRKKVLHAVLQEFGMESLNWNKFPRVAGTNNLASPASWTSEEFERKDFSSHGIPALHRAYWLFRARPDMLLLTEKYAIWIELKVDGAISQYKAQESYGADKAKFNQLATQLDIAALAGEVLTDVHDKEPVNIVIQRGTHTLDGGIISLTWGALTKGEENWDFPILY